MAVASLSDRMSARVLLFVSCRCRRTQWGSWSVKTRTLSSSVVLVLCLTCGHSKIQSGTWSWSNGLGLHASMWFTGGPNTDMGLCSSQVTYTVSDAIADLAAHTWNTQFVAHAASMFLDLPLHEDHLLKQVFVLVFVHTGEQIFKKYTQGSVFLTMRCVHFENDLIHRQPETTTEYTCTFRDVRMCTYCAR